MTINELREKAAKALGWKRSRKHGELYDYWRDADDIARFRAHGSGHGLWAPESSHDQAALLMAEVERRGLEGEFVDALLKLLYDSIEPAQCPYWPVANATPEQKTRAAVEALGEKGGGA